MKKIKVCKKCSLKKKASEFQKNSILKDGLSLYCKKCIHQYVKERREKNLELYLERERQYRRNRIEKIAEYQEKYYSRPEIKEKMKEYYKKYQKENKEKISGYHKKYYMKNIERLREKGIEYYYKKKSLTNKNK